MSLRTLPLRLKLVIALVLPMLLVTVLIGERVSGSLADRRVASAQQGEAARLEAVADFAGAVGSESVIANDPTATREQLSAARAATDTALGQLEDPALELDPDVVRRIGEHHDDIVGIRELVGDRPADIGLRFQVEVFIDRTAADSTASNTAETVPNALARLNALPTTILAEFDFDPDAVVDVETTRLLTDYDLVQRLRADHVQEVSALLQLAATPASVIDDDLIAEVRQQLTRTDVSNSLVLDYGAEDLVVDISAADRSAAGAEYARLRSTAENATPGVVPMGDIAAINRSGAAVTSQYAQLSDDVVASIRAQAEDTSAAARTSLVLVLLAGAWMLVIAALVLRLLYRAIRAPLRRLTEQSQHIANVELPYVVSAMRGGDLEEAPTTTDLVADADDEIGDLVHAFNDMHRTAVELAAEQAGSRKVVADMFVNLGRRNQRLVNRLLKRLTVLERDERDPDKLAGLYEIDHVVTRMRRNAESLLVLAGASQSRKWDRPVEIYDIAQAALSEIEGYARVEILAGDDFQIHGDVVSDLTHLLAEVVENAVTFSPPTAPVEVSIRRIGNDHVVSVSDVGVGMGESQLAEANDRILRAGVEDETPSEFLGHYVIGRLAARHGIDVRLAAGAEGRGLVADVILPMGVVVPAAGELVGDFDDAPTLAAPAPMTGAPESALVATELSMASLNDAYSAPTASPMPQPDSPPDHRPAPVAETFGEQPRRVPAEGPSGLVPTPSVEPAVAASAPSRETAVPDADAAPDTRSAATSSLAALATPPAASTPSAGSSFDYPPADQIDPRQREMAPRSAPAPSPEPVPTPTASVPVEPPTPTAPTPPTVEPESPGLSVPPAPTTGLTAAAANATDAVEGALSAFGSARRTPGASLPDTSLAAAISGHMTLDLGGPPSTPRAKPPKSPFAAPTTDPNEIRFQLSGFQSGTSRADQEE